FVPASGAQRTSSAAPRRATTGRTRALTMAASRTAPRALRRHRGARASTCRRLTA
ncbi:unnamed protein product, partial [Prorocentrum cordatum]